MRVRMKLTTKMLAVVVGVFVLAAFTSMVAISSAFRFQSLEKSQATEHLPSILAAEELSVAVLIQSGLVSSYVLDDGNPIWLERLKERRRRFETWLDHTRRESRSPQLTGLLNSLEQVQRECRDQRDEAVRLYDQGKHEEARQILLRNVVDLHEKSHRLSEEFVNANVALAEATTASVQREVQRVFAFVIVTGVMTVGLGIAMLGFFFKDVIVPLRHLADDARRATNDLGDDRKSGGDSELRELAHYLKRLMTDVSETRSDLERSRVQLAQADRLAAVGKLAASVAHEIRNPLTSMKMRIFSLRRVTSDHPEIRQKLVIVSEEIHRLENIVHHFLDFSRPPPVHVQSQNWERFLDKVLELLQYRMEERQVRLVRRDSLEIPEVYIDSEQLKQVFLNLIHNAIDAMPPEGQLELSSVLAMHGGREMLAVRVADSGPGMTEVTRAKIFEPFFTTKPDGTGLGLCIAASIMVSHGGSLELEKSDSQGTTWIVWLPTSPGVTQTATSGA